MRLPVIGRDTLKYIKYVGVSSLTIAFSLFMVFPHFQLEQLQVVSMYLIVMVGHWLNIRASLNRNDRRREGTQ